MSVYKVSLSKDDFLRYHLYTVSKSRKTKFKRIRSWILLTISFLLFGLILSESEDKFLMYYFYCFGLITLIFYPFYNSWYYKRHYKKHIVEHYKNKIGIECEISFNEEYLFSKDNVGEGKIKLSEIEVITEILENLFIKINSGDTIIISKKIPEYNLFNEVLKEVSMDNKIPWNKELDWKWR
ncbi:MAG: hypothetical protein HY951_03290 [Bacteroidia bacterium]|nr:hypothetical protein [Bacteroidia bacterium]